MKLKPIHIFLTLCVAFIVYSSSVYMIPLRSNTHLKFDRAMASEGKLVWQKYNCQSCHQLYGLGGYLGPDLTNVYSEPGKGPAWITAMLTTGVRQMPVFNLSEDEERALLQFLKSTDESGIADPRKFKTDITGMVDTK